MNVKNGTEQDRVLKLSVPFLIMSMFSCSAAVDLILALHSWRQSDNVIGLSSGGLFLAYVFG